VIVGEWCEGGRLTQPFSVGSGWAISWITWAELREPSTLFTLSIADMEGNVRAMGVPVGGDAQDIIRYPLPGRFFLAVDTGQRWRIVVADRR
jgi:hypothetical protein